ncbi:MAG: ABC transporter ATP-binding protein [Gemmatimonadota bacterium]
MSPILEAHGVTKHFIGGDGKALDVLRGVDLSVEPGEFVAIAGASGSGKSTLLHLLGALDRPTSGEIVLGGSLLGELDMATLADIRNRRVGFVFQFHHLLPEFSATENVAMPLLIAGTGPAQAYTRANELLASLGLGNRLLHLPSQLSGGEQQRVAIARALAPNPGVILADEPSGNLDPANAERLHDLLASLGEQFGTALVVATHSRTLANRADRVLVLSEGVLLPERSIGAETAVP